MDRDKITSFLLSIGYRGTYKAKTMNSPFSSKAFIEVRLLKQPAKGVMTKLAEAQEKPEFSDMIFTPSWPGAFVSSGPGGTKYGTLEDKEDI